MEVIVPLVPLPSSSSALVVEPPLLLNTCHITTELVTFEAALVQEREMEVAVVEVTLTLGWSGAGTEGYGYVSVIQVYKTV